MPTAAQKQEQRHEPREQIARAQRFLVCAPIHYRPRGESEWRNGSTVNMSSSGVLFEVEDQLPPGMLLEMHVKLLEQITGGVSSSVLCWGPVVRTEGSSLAAAILKYRFTHE
jgi:hypothetical protein